MNWYITLGTTVIAVVVYFVINLFGCSDNAEGGRELAKKALYAVSNNPESIRIIAVSKPDSVFNRNYVNENEVPIIMDIMMKASDDMADAMSLEEPETTDDAARFIAINRKMSALSDINSLMMNTIQLDGENQFSGWKIKVEYEDYLTKDVVYHAEFWAILDKDMTCVVKTLEIPLM